MKRLPKPSLVKIRMKRTGRHYCTPTYAAMEAGASWVLLGHPKTAIPILEKSRSEWAGNHTEVRDYALCVSRLALAYAAGGDVERAWAATERLGARPGAWLAPGSRPAQPALPWAGGGDGILPWLACERG